MKIAFACFALVSIAASQASAAIVFEVGNTTFDDTFVGTFSLTVSGVASGQNEILNSYGLPFDIDPDGTGLPAGLTLLGATRIATPAGLFSTGATANEDLLVTHALTSISINDGNSLDLFTLDFVVTSPLAAGSYAVDLNENNIGFYIVTGPSSLGTPIDGLITVTAVPEPSSLVLLGAMGLTCLAYRRRKMRLVERV